MSEASTSERANAKIFVDMSCTCGTVRCLDLIYAQLAANGLGAELPSPASGAEVSGIIVHICRRTLTGLTFQSRRTPRYPAEAIQSP